jgi:hypothetical protein
MPVNQIPEITGTKLGCNQKKWWDKLWAQHVDGVGRLIAWKVGILSNWLVTAQ